MASEMVKQVLSAESASDARIAEAQKSRARLLEEAQAQAQQAEQAQIAAAAADGQQLQAETQERIRQYSRQTAEACDRQKAAIMETAKKNRSAAVNQILTQLFGSQEGW